jgi:hypothetical protein
LKPAQAGLVNFLFYWKLEQNEAKAKRKAILACCFNDSCDDIVNCHQFTFNVYNNEKESSRG